MKAPMKSGSITLATLKDLQAQCADLQTGCFLHLEDETINRALKTVTKRLTKYVALASASKTQSLTTAEMERHGLE